MIEKLKHQEKAFTRLAILVSGMFLGCFIFIGVLFVVGTSGICYKELLPVFKGTLFIVGGFMLITTVLLIKNQRSLEKLK